MDEVNIDCIIWRLLAIENPGTWNITYVNAPMA